MLKKNLLNQVIGLSMLIAATSTYAVGTTNNFNCPDVKAIQAIDFSVPSNPTPTWLSVWIAPPVAHSLKGQVGAGFGGSKAVQWVGAEAAQVGHKDGWICVYISESGIAPREIEKKIRDTALGNHYLKKYVEKIDKAYADADPYLSKYEKLYPNKQFGFVGYQGKK